MTAYFVSRHRGAVEWAQRRGIAATLISHLEPAIIQKGDLVLGTLPIQLVARINESGARYLHLEMEAPEKERGKDLTADDMERIGAKLVEYEARQVLGTADETDCHGEKK